MGILIVGAGLSGATIARSLADADYEVHVIDKRSHIAGNAFDFLHANGELIHKYGPHLLHGSEDSIAIKWLSRFTEWIPYEHKVKALLPNESYTSLPVCKKTLEDVFNVELNSEKEAAEFLESKRDKSIETPKNTDEMFLFSVGEELTNLFFRPYTRKMWGLDPKDLEVAVGARLPVRTSDDDRYFNDNFQALPKKGYTEMVKNILNHPNIKVSLETAFSDLDKNDYSYTFASIPIDQFYNYKFGRLPYRSIKFHEKTVTDPDQPAPVVNFTDDQKFTRKTQWGLLPNSPLNKVKNSKLVTYEEPCSPEDNNYELYYPVRNKESLEIYSKYQELASLNSSSFQFIGRTGLFRYLDMVPAVNIHLKIAKDFLENQQAS